MEILKYLIAGLSNFHSRSIPQRNLLMAWVLIKQWLKEMIFDAKSFSLHHNWNKVDVRYAKERFNDFDISCSSSSQCRLLSGQKLCNIDRGWFSCTKKNKKWKSWHDRIKPIWVNENTQILGPTIRLSNIFHFFRIIFVVTLNQSIQILRVNNAISTRNWFRVISLGYYLHVKIC